MDQAGHTHLLEQRGGFAGFTGRVAGHAYVQRLALLHGAGQCAHGFFQRGVGIETVRIKNVYVVQVHALQALVQAGQHIFASAAALAVRTGPHVVTGLAGDHQLVAVRAEVAAHVFAKVGLGAAVGWAVVVGQVEMGDAQVKGRCQHGALGGHGRGVAKVVPQAQGDGGQFQAAAAGAAVLHFVVVAVGCGMERHGVCLRHIVAMKTAF